MYPTIYSAILGLARFMAMIGGFVLSGLIIVTCLSIVGRLMSDGLNSDWVQKVAPNLAQFLIEFGIGPIRGSFELVEVGMAFCIFAFLPLCQIRGSHAQVDIFATKLSVRINQFLQWLADALFAVVLTVIAFQLYSGMMSKVRSGQTSFLLEYPVWWGYALSLVGAIIAAFIAVYIAVERSREWWTGKVLLPMDKGAEH